MVGAKSLNSNIQEKEEMKGKNGQMQILLNPKTVIFIIGGSTLGYLISNNFDPAHPALWIVLGFIFGLFSSFKY